MIQYDVTSYCCTVCDYTTPRLTSEEGFFCVKCKADRKQVKMTPRVKR